MQMRSNMKANPDYRDKKIIKKSIQPMDTMK